MQWEWNIAYVKDDQCDLLEANSLQGGLTTYRSFQKTVECEQQRRFVGANIDLTSLKINQLTYFGTKIYSSFKICNTKNNIKGKF